MNRFKSVFSCVLLILLALKCFDCYPFKRLSRSPDYYDQPEQPASLALESLLAAHRSSLNLKNGPPFAAKKHSSFLKNVTLFKYRHTQQSKKQPKIVLVNVSSLASSPPLPYLSASPNQESKENRIDFLYEDLKFYLISTLNLNQLKLIAEIAEQKDDFLDLIVKKEHRQVLTNIRKLINYLRFKEVLFFGEHKDDRSSINEVLKSFESADSLRNADAVKSLAGGLTAGDGQPSKFSNLKNGELLGTLCKSELPIEILIRMFILVEWINKQSNKQNFFDFRREEPIAALEPNFKQIKSEFMVAICSRSN